MALPTQHLSAPAHQSQQPPPQRPHVNNEPPVPPRRDIAPSLSSSSLVFPHSVTMQNLGASSGVQGRSSRTWTASSGDICLLSDTDELEDRAVFVMEYNRLARKHGVRILVLEDFEGRKKETPTVSPEKRGWLQRLLRSSSNNPPTTPKADMAVHPRHKRSVSDVAHHLVLNRRETPPTVDLQAMVRFSGKSVFYLPAEHAPGAIVLPTCIRATAQHLAHNAMTRGIFRIPGSVKIVNALFDYYCYIEGGGAGLASTVRCVNLPMHIQSSVHDVASTFKKMLSVLPGGILGSLGVFDAMVAIHSHFHGDPEFPRTKQTRVRARLIALALGTIKSQFRRELICAVFGLLSLIGRIAEVTPREDDSGRALPTADLMGYNALGIVFGPLLVGDLLDHYTMKITNPGYGLMLFPVTPQKLKRDRRKSKPTDGVPPAQTNVDKVIVSNSITEMLITNWRDVVRQMKAIGAHRRTDMSMTSVQPGSLRPSASETFVIKKPQDWDNSKVKAYEYAARNDSSGPPTPTMGIKRQRPRHMKSSASTTMAIRPINALSPTLEVDTPVDQLSDFQNEYGHDVSTQKTHSPMSARLKYEKELLELQAEVMRDLGDAAAAQAVKSSDNVSKIGRQNQPTGLGRRENTMYGSPQVSMESVPPRTSSRPRYATTVSRTLEHVERSSWDDSPEAEYRSSLEVQRGRRGNKSVAINGQRSVDHSPVPIARRTRPTPRPTPQSSRASRSQKQSSSGVDRAQSISTLTARRNNPQSDLMSDKPGPSRALHDDRDYLPSSGKARRSEDTSKPRALEYDEEESPPLDTHEYFYLTANGDVERHHRSRAPEEVKGVSGTPQQFYAPMRTPSQLTRQGSAGMMNQPVARMEA